MIRKIPSILQSYLYFLMFKSGFINDVNYKKVLRQRIASCENCILREGNWCSRKKVTAIINDEGKQQRISGCGCYLPAKIFDNTPDPCVLHKWEDFTND